MLEDIKFSFPVAANHQALADFLCVRIPLGKYKMGSLNGLPYASEGPVHEVAFSEPLAMAKCPVTQTLFTAVMGQNPSKFTTYSSAPVECVDWLAANEFCEKLSNLIQKTVRLPSEAEWEYACRAGTSSEYFWGDRQSEIDNYAWYEFNSNDQTHPVGNKMPNAWGLFDMVGNVWEHCADVWHGSYEGAPSDGSAWLSDLALNKRRVVRGGAWNMDAFRCRPSYRSYDWLDSATDKLGFRVVVELD